MQGSDAIRASVDTAKPRGRACKKHLLVEISRLNLQAPTRSEEETGHVWGLGMKRVHLCTCERGKDHGTLAIPEGSVAGDAVL